MKARYSDILGSYTKEKPKNEAKAKGCEEALDDWKKIREKKNLAILIHDISESACFTMTANPKLNFMQIDIQMKLLALLTPL